MVQRSPDRAAQIVDQHVVVANLSLGVQQYAIEHIDHRADFYLEPRLFGHLAREARRLAQWEASLASVEPEHLHDLVEKYQSLPTLDAVRDAMRFDIHRRATQTELEAVGRVLFGFDGDALNRVHLAAAKAGAATCEDVEKGMTAQHGKAAQRERTGGSLKGDEITWKLPDQTIVLSCAGVASLGFQTVTLDFLEPATAVAKN